MKKIYSKKLKNGFENKYKYEKEIILERSYDNYNVILY